MSEIHTTANPDLVVVEENKSHWSQAGHRRHGLHNLFRIARYGTTFRSARVMVLEKRIDRRIEELDRVRHLTSLPWFSAMVVIRDQEILFERYAPDFGKDCPHSIQSITKTMMNLVVGRLVEDGVLDLSRRIKDYLREIGSGYAAATLQQVLNMDVVNEYSEDFTDPQATYYRHEEAMGWRLPHDSVHEQTQHSFIAGIESQDTTNISGHMQYKDANTEVLGWVVERGSGRPLRSFLADIVDASGLEACLHMTTDREGVPTLSGGACLTARDLARYMSLFVRRGRGVGGEVIGSAEFIERTIISGVPKAKPYERVRYSNQTAIVGRSLMHSGWGGQCAMANLDTGMVAVFFSVLEDRDGIDRDYQDALVQMLESVTSVAR